MADNTTPIFPIDISGPLNTELSNIKIDPNFNLFLEKESSMFGGSLSPYYTETFNSEDETVIMEDGNRYYFKDNFLYRNDEETPLNTKPFTNYIKKEILEDKTKASINNIPYLMGNGYIKAAYVNPNFVVYNEDGSIKQTYYVGDYSNPILKNRNMDSNRNVVVIADVDTKNYCVIYSPIEDFSIANVTNGETESNIVDFILSYKPEEIIYEQDIYNFYLYGTITFLHNENMPIVSGQLSKRTLTTSAYYQESGDFIVANQSNKDNILIIEQRTKTGLFESGRPFKTNLNKPVSLQNLFINIEEPFFLNSIYNTNKSYTGNLELIDKDFTIPDYELNFNTLEATINFVASVSTEKIKAKNSFPFEFSVINNNLFITGIVTGNVTNEDKSTTIYYNGNTFNIYSFEYNNNKEIIDSGRVSNDYSFLNIDKLYNQIYINDNFKFLTIGKNISSLGTNKILNSGKLLTPMYDGLDENFLNVFSPDTFQTGESSLTFLDYNKNLIKVSFNAEPNITKILGRYILVNSTDIFNLFDTKNNKWLDYATDYNGYLDLGVTKEDLEDSRPSNRNLVASINNAIEKTGIPTTSIQQPVIFFEKCHISQTKTDLNYLNVDVFDGVSNDEINTPNYSFTINNKKIVTNKRLINTLFTPVADNDYLTEVPTMFSIFKSSGGYGTDILINNSAYLLYLKDGETYFFGNYFNALRNFTNVFLLQGNIFAILNDKICLCNYSGDVLQSTTVIAPVDDLDFIGITSDMAIFYNNFLKRFYSFTGDRILRELFDFSKYDKIKSQYFNSASNRIYLVIDNGETDEIICIGDQIFTVYNKMKIEDIVILKDCVVITDNYNSIFLYNEYKEDRQILPVYFKTSFFGQSQNKTSIYQSLNFRLFKEKNRKLNPDNFEVETILANEVIKEVPNEINFEDYKEVNIFDIVKESYFDNTGWINNPERTILIKGNTTDLNVGDKVKAKVLFSNQVYFAFGQITDIEDNNLHITHDALIPYFGEQKEVKFYSVDNINIDSLEQVFDYKTNDSTVTSNIDLDLEIGDSFYFETILYNDSAFNNLFRTKITSVYKGNNTFYVTNVENLDIISSINTKETKEITLDYLRTLLNNLGSNTLLLPFDNYKKDDYIEVTLTRNFNKYDVLFRVLEDQTQYKNEVEEIIVNPLVLETINVLTSEDSSHLLETDLYVQNYSLEHLIKKSNFDLEMDTSDVDINTIVKLNYFVYKNSFITNNYYEYFGKVVSKTETNVTLEYYKAYQKDDLKVVETFNQYNDSPTLELKQVELAERCDDRFFIIKDSKIAEPEINVTPLYTNGLLVKNQGTPDYKVYNVKPINFVSDLEDPRKVFQQTSSTDTSFKETDLIENYYPIVHLENLDFDLYYNYTVSCKIDEKDAFLYLQILDKVNDTSNYYRCLYKGFDYAYTLNNYKEVELFTDLILDYKTINNININNGNIDVKESFNKDTKIAVPFKMNDYNYYLAGTILTASMHKIEFKLDGLFSFIPEPPKPIIVLPKLTIETQVINSKVETIDNFEIEIYDELFDDFGNAYIRYQPKEQHGVGISYKILCPVSIISLEIGLVPEANVLIPDIIESPNNAND